VVKLEFGDSLGNGNYTSNGILININQPIVIPSGIKIPDINIYDNYLKLKNAKYVNVSSSFVKTPSNWKLVI